MKKILLLSVLSGLLLGLSWPSLGVPAFLFFALVPLLWIQHSLQYSPEKKKKRKLLLSLLIAFTLWNVLSTGWLYNAQRPDGSHAIEAFLIPLCFNLILYSGAFMMYNAVKTKAGNYFGFLFLPIVWLMVEKLQLSWEFNWPWLNLGNAFALWHPLIQWYEYTGSLGGSLWLLICNILVFYTLKTIQNGKTTQEKWKMGIQTSLFIILPMFVSLGMYFSYQEDGESVEIVALQPELDPYTQKYNLASQKIVQDLLDLAKEEASPKTQFVIAPETAFPGPDRVNLDFIDQDPSVLMIQNWLQNYPDVQFISGVDLFQVYSQEQKTETARKFKDQDLYYDSYNAAVSLGGIQTVPMVYKKSKLVPGAESFPYSSFFMPLVGSVMMDFGGTTSTLGKSKKPLVFENKQRTVKIAPLICYESVFGEYTTEFVKKGAQILAVMSNDSWWGESQGYKQLLHFAKLRAIETRRSVVRSANSGESAFINQRGDIEISLPYLNKGALVHSLKTNDKITVYVLYGDYIFRIALFLGGIILAYTLTLFVTQKKNLKTL
ncbi:MAG: apolipoprotein N-acyltransferase [Flavobacteriaceae bacterium]|nr:MAG: apolipoprotein N-acyltransferase [Flavobacteriaceae bacterium]